MDGNWTSAAMSGDGKTIVVGENTGRVYLSTNSGSSWSETRPAGNSNYNWQSIAMTDDGQTIIAATYGNGLYRSTNRGSTWSEIQPLGNTDGTWNSVGISDNAQTIVAGVDGYRLYQTTNGGISWQELQPLGNTDNDWRVTAVSDDGQKILVGQSTGSSANGRLFLSTDGGSSYNEVQPAGNVDRDWYLGTMSGDGYTLISGVSGGRLYLGLYPLPTVSTGYQWASTTDTPHCNDAKPASSPQLFQITTSRNKATLYFTPIGNIRDYIISFSTKPSAEDYGASVTLSAEGVQNYSIYMLAPLTQYYFKVRGQNGCMPGDWSNILSGKTTNNTLNTKNFFLFQ